ncbi:MAG: bacillithiol transferase BstA [Pedobacter sp.]|jgi:uncharacterized damage-inducible protein DinB
MSSDLEKLKYPIGKFKNEVIDAEDYPLLMERIAALPGKIRAAVADLSDEQLDTPYREGGWTLRQVVHHLPDSHLNAYMRFKLAITEDNPTIKPYAEDRWAECTEAKYGPLNDSLDLLDSLHRRWVSFLRTLGPEDFFRTYYHPAQEKKYELGTVLSLYVWHGEHHLAHITETKRSMGW